jgi:hypothetical protein
MRLRPLDVVRDLEHVSSVLGIDHVTNIKHGDKQTAEFHSIPVIPNANVLILIVYSVYDAET